MVTSANNLLYHKDFICLAKYGIANHGYDAPGTNHDDEHNYCCEQQSLPFSTFTVVIGVDNPGVDYPYHEIEEQDTKYGWYEDVNESKNEIY
jgi:hypothetical protein